MTLLAATDQDVLPLLVAAVYILAAVVVVVVVVVGLPADSELAAHSSLPIVREQKPKRRLAVVDVAGKLYGRVDSQLFQKGSLGVAAVHYIR